MMQQRCKPAASLSTACRKYRAAEPACRMSDSKYSPVASIQRGDSLTSTAFVTHILCNRVIKARATPRAASSSDAGKSQVTACCQQAQPLGLQRSRHAVFFPSTPIDHCLPLCCGCCVWLRSPDYVKAHMPPTSMLSNYFAPEPYLSMIQNQRPRPAYMNLNVSCALPCCSLMVE
jgi:hypothetical protein